MVFILGGRKLLLIRLEDKRHYDAFVDFLFDNCKYGSFHLPNFESCNNKISFSCRNEFLNRSDLQYKNYVQNCKEIINLIKEDIVNASIKRSYCESTYGFYTLVYIFRLNKDFKSYLKSKDSLFYWDRDNELPEDLGFYKASRKCFVSVISHDERVALYEETDLDMRYLKSVGISFSKVPRQLIKNVETPFI